MRAAGTEVGAAGTVGRLARWWVAWQRLARWWHGGYGWRGGYYGPWGWGLGGLGLGLYFATLPYYYSTYWWGGVPYYYAGRQLLHWNSGVGQYQTVAPPAEVFSQAGGGQAGGRRQVPRI